MPSINPHMFAWALLGADDCLINPDGTRTNNHSIDQLAQLKSIAQEIDQRVREINFCSHLNEFTIDNFFESYYPFERKIFSFPHRVFSMELIWVFEFDRHSLVAPFFAFTWFINWIRGSFAVNIFLGNPLPFILFNLIFRGLLKWSCLPKITGPIFMELGCCWHMNLFFIPAGDQSFLHGDW